MSRLNFSRRGAGTIRHRGTQALTRADYAGVAVPGNRVLYWSSADRDALLDETAALGVKWIRTDCTASEIEVTQGVRDWAPLDGFVAAAKARNLKVLLIISSLPAWARDAAGPNTWERGAITQAERDAYTDFGVAAIERFQQVDAWEMWNEPNYTVFWKPTPVNGGAYAALVAQAYPRFKAAARAGVPIIAGGTAWTSTTNGVQTREWYADLYARGANVNFDAVTTHPYQDFGWCRVGEYFTGQEMGWVADLRTTMNNYGDTTKPIWGTEVGFPTGGAPDTFVTETEQASWLPPTYTGWADQTTVRGKTGPLFWYEVRDGDTLDTTERENHFGLTRTDRSLKPAYTALKDWIG